MTDPTVTVRATPAGWTVEPDQAATAAQIADAVASLAGGEAHVWLSWMPAPVRDAVEALIDPALVLRRRTIVQMAVAVPVAGEAADTRPFRPDDADRWVATNNAAFAWHPEQGAMSPASLAEALAEPWVDLDGFLVVDDPDDRDRLAGFCWTRCWPDDPTPHGEIYVIAVHPAHHGTGLGRRLTVAGLNRIAAYGFDEARLWVEADNEPARGLYRSLGMTDRAERWALVVDRSSTSA